MNRLDYEQQPRAAKKLNPYIALVVSLLPAAMYAAAFARDGSPTTQILIVIFTPLIAFAAFIATCFTRADDLRGKRVVATAILLSIASLIGSVWMAILAFEHMPG
jgi:hypothetical protein